MRKIFVHIIVLFLMLGCNIKSKQDQTKVVVFCASSLTNVVSEIAESFKIENNIDVQLNFASSGTLARQIEHGANPDVFISANKKWINYLNTIGESIPEYEKKIAGNSLVVVTPIDSKIDSFSFESEANFSQLFKGRLSIGDPNHVPVGEYAMQVIDRMSFKEELKDRLLPAKDARSALLVVELGASEVGIIYKTDALESKKVNIVSEIPTQFHSPIGYYISILKNSKSNNTLLFYEFLNSEISKQIWMENGFKMDK